MKKTLTWIINCFAIATIILGYTNCQTEEPKRPDPIFDLEETLIEVSQEGGTAEITYSIENAVQGIGIKAECEDSWVHDFDCRQKNVITFTVDPNEAEETRETTVTVTYGEKSESFTVRQAEYIAPAPFNITIDDLTETSVIASVEPFSEKTTYLTAVVKKDYYDEYYKTEQEFVNGIIEMFEERARNSFLSLYDYLTKSGQLKSGERELHYIGLYPNEDYFLGIFGINVDTESNWETSTPIILEKFTTVKPDIVDINFSFNYEIDGGNVNMQVSPSNLSQLYYFDAIKKTEIENLGITIEEAAQRYLINYINQGAAYGMPEEQVMQEIGSTGECTKNLELNAESEYIGFACSITEKGAVNSTVSVQNFFTESPETSDNRLLLDIISVNADRVECKVTSSNNDPYVIVAGKTNDWKEKTDSEIMNGLLQNDLSNNFREGNWEGTLIGLEPETEYMIFAFGVTANAPTTPLTKKEIKTISPGDPRQLSFSYDIKVKAYKEVVATVSGEPNNAGFYWEIINPKKISPEEFKTSLMEMAEFFSPGDPYSYLQKVMTRGTMTQTYTALWGDTDYAIYAVGIEDGTGKLVTDVNISEVFHTLPRTKADIKITPIWNNFYNAEELAKLYPDYFGNDSDKYSGKVAIVFEDMIIEGNDECRLINLSPLKGDYTDIDLYKDEEIIDAMRAYKIVYIVNPGIDYHKLAVVDANTDITIAAYGTSSENIFGSFYREKFNFNLNNASPVEEFKPFWSKGQKIAENNHMGKDKETSNDRFTQNHSNIQINQINSTTRRAAKNSITNNNCSHNPIIFAAEKSAMNK